MRSIDLNCDMGESFGTWVMGQDAEVMPHVTSANIACGFHAGDPDTMRRTVALAVHHGVAIGAHPSLPDLAGFGRRRMAISANDAYALVIYQVGALAAFAHAADTRLHHVKLHGALYNMVYADRVLATAIAEAIAAVDRRLIVYAQSNGVLVDIAETIGLYTCSEVFADRRYLADGSLAPRGETGAVIGDIGIAVAQGLALARYGRADAMDGSLLQLRAGTLCVHGDNPDAAEFAGRLRAALDGAGIPVAAPRAGDASALHGPFHS